MAMLKETRKEKFKAYREELKKEDLSEIVVQDNSAFEEIKAEQSSVEIIQKAQRTRTILIAIFLSIIVIILLVLLFK